MTQTYDIPEGAAELAAPELPESATIFQRMVAILADLPAIGKSQTNTQQGFKFRGHDDVLNALNPLLARHGVFVVPMVLERQDAQRTTGAGKIMYEVNLHVRYRFHGLAGDFVQASAWGEGTDSGDKSTNKAMTMAFKNVLAQAFAVSTADSPDADAGSPEDTYASGPRAGRAPAAKREFDVAADLLPGAQRVNDEASMNSLRAVVAFLDPTIEPSVWLRIEEQAMAAVYGATLSPEDWGQHWKRLANAATRARERGTLMGTDFPDRQILVEAFAWAYEGFTTDLLSPRTDAPMETPAKSTSAAENAAHEATDTETEATS